MPGTEPSLPLPLSCIPSADNSGSMNETFGALLLSTFTGIMLYGLSLHQLYRYFRLYPKDIIFVRVVVILTMMFETVHTCLTLHACYFYLVYNYLCPRRLESSVWSVTLLPLFTGIIMFISQTFFARRLYKVGPGYRKIVLLAMVFLLGEIVITVQLYSQSSLDAFVKKTWLISGCSGMAAVADTLLTIALTVMLQRSRTGMKRTNHLIDVLTVYTINTGLATGVSNIISLIFASVMPQKFLYVCFSIITARLYGNTLLAAVNSRAFSLPGGSQVYELDGMPRSHGILASASRSATSTHRGTHQIEQSCSSVVNIKAVGEEYGVPERKRETPGADFVVQLPHARPAVEDVKSIAIG